MSKKSYEKFLKLKNKIDNIDKELVPSIFYYDDMNDILKENIDSLLKELKQKINNVNIINYLDSLVNGREVYSKEEFCKKISKYDSDIYNEILNYLYWKSRKEESNILSKINSIKSCLKCIDILNLYIEPITIKVSCPCCNKKTDMKIYEYKLELECKSCGHLQYLNRGKYSMNPFFTECQCNYCKSKMEEYLQESKKVISLLYEFIDILYDEYKCKICDEDPPSNKELYNGYRLHVSTLNKDIREVISLRPKNEEELNKIINAISRRECDGDSIKRRKDKILEDLELNNIVYTIKFKLNKEQFFKIIIKHIVYCSWSYEFIESDKKHTGYSNINTNYYYDSFIWLYKHIEEMNLSDFKEICINSLDFKYKIPAKYIIDSKDPILNKVDMNPIGMINFEFRLSNYDYIYECAISQINVIKVLNYNFFENRELRKHLNKPSRFYINLFSSQDEISIFHILRNRYMDKIIIPNKKLSTIIDLQKFENLYEKEELNYLKKCKVDFSVYSLEGDIDIIIFINKDKDYETDELKKEILNICRIEWEEFFTN